MRKIHTSELNRHDLKGAMLRGELIFERIFSSTDAGVENRTFHVWKSKGLLGFIEKGTWGRVSFVGLIWLQLLESMRRFGCPVSLMKKLYEYYFTRAFDENLAEKTLQENIQFYETLSTQRPLTEDESAVRIQLHQLNQDPLLKMALRTEISYFSHLILECLRAHAETGIIIYEDGSFTDYVNDIEKLDHGGRLEYESKPHIRIPISSYIIEFITDESRDEFLRKTALFDEDEYRVVKEMRNKNVQSITIKFREEDHRPEFIECDRGGMIKGDQAKRVMSILGLKNYSAIDLKTRDGNSLSFKYKEKKYL
jgi:hypothetical protein